MTAHVATGNPEPSTAHEETDMTSIDAPLRPTPEALRAADTPNATGPRPARRFAAVLRSEWIKCHTVWATKVLLAVAAVAGLAISWATAAFSTGPVLTAAEVFVYPTLLTAVLAAVAGILLFTSEVQHGTLAVTLAAHPSRWGVVAAKTVLAAAIGVVLGSVGMSAGFLGAQIGGLDVGDTSGLAATVMWALLYTVGAGLFGLGVGMVVRHSAGAVSGLLVWWLVVEGLVVSFAPAGLVRFVPFDAGARTLDIATDLDRPEVVAAALPNPLHALIFWSYVAAAVALGAVMLRRRDVD
ncbi:MAG: hypothetical protein EKK62_05385 [Acidimicrobiia bacterium]|nr:ABC transporter permease [Microthrixaceae bacterium]RTL08849.1 MAG: hypothetical protein EKK62_05385 [Acidimicrobiia bacterium]